MTLRYIDLGLVKELEDRDFRHEWFRAQLEADVPELFRDMREARDLTQSQLAEATGMKQSAISRFEGSRDATWKLLTLLKLAEALDARLTIGLERAEDVIARYKREEAEGSPPRGSVLSVAPVEGRNRNLGIQAMAEDSPLSAGAAQRSTSAL